MSGYPEDPRNKILDDILNDNPSTFLDGRDFRAYHEFSILSGQEDIIKIETPIDLYITNITLNLSDGSVRYSVLVGGTEGGVFTEIQTILNKNNRSDAAQYTRQTQAYAGGNLTGGSEIDVAQIRTGTNNQRVSIIESAQSKRGVAAGTYYIKIENNGNGTAEGVLYTFWTE